MVLCKKVVICSSCGKRICYRDSPDFREEDCLKEGNKKDCRVGPKFDYPEGTMCVECSSTNGTQKKYRSVW